MLLSKMKTNGSKLLAFILLIAMVAPLAGKDKKRKLKIFIMSGQSNTVGHARAHTIATLYNTNKGKDKELREMVFGSSSKVEAIWRAQVKLGKEIDAITGGARKGKLNSIKDAAEKAKVVAKVSKMEAQFEAYKKQIIEACKVSDRVYITSIADRNKRSGKLSTGFGADKIKIGPEYGFGLTMAEKIDGPILIIKASWGGKAINYQFRPPSSGEYVLNDKEKAKGDKFKNGIGVCYRDMTAKVHEVLKDLKKYHPNYDSAAGYEIAGFVWFQGFNDQFDPRFKANYKQNMINFIKDVRKEFKAPKMPFVVGVLGTGMTADKVSKNAVSLGQRDAAKELGLKNKVISSESYIHYAHDSYEIFKRGWAKHYREWDSFGSDRPYHYLGSGKFFVRLGNGFAEDMLKIMK